MEVSDTHASFEPSPLFTFAQSAVQLGICVAPTWASLPQREYLPVVELSEPLKRELSRIVLAAWARKGNEQW